MTKECDGIEWRRPARSPQGVAIDYRSRLSVVSQLRGAVLESCYLVGNRAPAERDPPSAAGAALMGGRSSLGVGMALRRSPFPRRPVAQFGPVFVASEMLCWFPEHIPHGKKGPQDMGRWSLKGKLKAR